MCKREVEGNILKVVARTRSRSPLWMCWQFSHRRRECCRFGADEGDDEKQEDRVDDFSRALREEKNNFTMKNPQSRTTHKHQRSLWGGRVRELRKRPRNKSKTVRKSSAERTQQRSHTTKATSSASQHSRVRWFFTVATRRFVPPKPKKPNPKCWEKKISVSIFHIFFLLFGLLYFSHCVLSSTCKFIAYTRRFVLVRSSNSLIFHSFFHPKIIKK
jgi:hypothetical protein